MIGSERDRPWVPGMRVCSENAGIAIAMSSAADTAAESAGRRSTRSSTKLQTRPPCPASLRRRCRNGIRPLSTRSPSFDSSAGSTVSEPTIAIATTITVPVAKELNVLSPVKYMPAIAAMTVNPETSTARPDVAAAA